jgi:hypothetical protein
MHLCMYVQPLVLLALLLPCQGQHRATWYHLLWFHIVDYVMQP